MREFIVLMILVASTVLSSATLGGAAADAPAATAESEMTSGEVRRVDAVQGKITIRHGEIRNLGMPPMTMVFRVRSTSLLDGIERGERVLFWAVEEDGEFVIEEMIAVP